MLFLIKALSSLSNANIDERDTFTYSNYIDVKTNHLLLDIKVFFTTETVIG